MNQKPKERKPSVKGTGNPMPELQHVNCIYDSDTEYSLSLLANVCKFRSDSCFAGVYEMWFCDEYKGNRLTILSLDSAAC